jgi:capsular polysaccharide biosynthesis protein
MTDKMRDSNGTSRAPFVAFIVVFSVVTISVSIIATVVTFILQESYASTARIRVTPDQPSDIVQSNETFIATTCEIIKSAVVLNPVIEKLNLNERWGKKYFNGDRLKTAESLEILKPRLELAPVRNTMLISITVYSDDKMEAAQIANEITDSYRNYRLQNGSLSLPESLVQVIDPAKPGLAPVKPNKPLYIALGMLIGGVIGALLGGIAALMTSKTGSRT